MITTDKIPKEIIEAIVKWMSRFSKNDDSEIATNNFWAKIELAKGNPAEAVKILQRERKYWDSRVMYAASNVIVPGETSEQTLERVRFERKQASDKLKMIDDFLIACDVGGE